MLKALIARLLNQSKPAPIQSEESVAGDADAATTESSLNLPSSSASLPDVSATQPTEPAGGTHSAASPAPSYATADSLAIDEVRQAGPIIWSAESRGWCINSSTSFPLTVVKCDQRTASAIREALDQLVNHSMEEVTEVVASLVVERGARFQELENYIEMQRQTYRAALATAHGKRALPPTVQEDLINEEIEAEAINSLDQCCDDLGDLLEGEYPTNLCDLEVIRHFGYRNLLRYLSAGPSSVKLVSAGHRDRVRVEGVVSAGLAICGERISEIPTEALLRALTLKDIQALSLLPIPSKLRKKNLAIEFVLTQQEIRERLIESIAVCDVVYFIPPPDALAHVDLGAMHARMKFALSAIRLVVTTYLTAALAPTNREYEGRHLADVHFRAHNVKDVFTCQTCRKTNGEARPLSEWILFPFHFGCRCSLLIDAR